MKTSIKQLIVGCAMLCAGAAQAADITVPTDDSTDFRGAYLTGTTTWRFSDHLSNGLLQVPSPAGATVGVHGGAWQEQEVHPALDEFGEPTEYSIHVIHSEATTLTIDDVSGEVKAVASKGGTTWAFGKSYLVKAAGGRAEIGELDVRFQADGSVDVHGVINGQALGGASGVSYAGLLFTVQASDVEGSLSFANGPSSFQQVTLHRLALSGAGLDALVQSFGLAPSGLMYTALTFVQPDFGSLQVDVRAVVPVPEPSALALMGVGLVGLFVLRRHRSA